MRALPDLVATRPFDIQSLHVVGGEVIAVRSDLPDDSGTDLGSLRAWHVVGADWLPWGPIDGSRVIGSTGEFLVVAIDSIQPPAAPPPLSITQLDGTSERLQSPLDPSHVVGVDDGFVLIGGDVRQAGTAREAPVAVRWSRDAGWTRLDEPPLTPGPHGLVWVPGGAGPGQVVMFGGVPTGVDPVVGPRVAGAVLDLATGSWSDVPIPLGPIAASEIGSNLAVAWDGDRTVWVHGGAQQTLQLAYDLVEGTLSVARPAGPGLGGALHWTGQGLVLLDEGGFSGTSSTAVPAPSAIEVWSPLP